jgi:hypothetical protein
MPAPACSYCGHPVPLDWSLCPHCARPSLYPNVRAAEQEDERKALAIRHEQAVRDAEARGCGGVVRDFEVAAGASAAVLTRPLGEVERLASSDRQLYSTYYQLLEAEVKLPDGDEWEPLRHLADEALFRNFKEKIRFAALALDGVGLPHYGECTLVLREEMIAHRASLLEDNSALLMKRVAYNLPAGLRATWPDRVFLCVAKLADRFCPETKKAEFASLLMRPRSSPELDEFVEVHIWGPMTRRTFAKVILRRRPGSRPALRSVVKALRLRLAGAGVDFEER